SNGWSDSSNAPRRPDPFARSVRSTSASEGSDSTARSASSVWSTLPPQSGGRRGGDGYGSWKDGKHVTAPRNPTTERELYGDAEDSLKQHTGINFDKYEDIPVDATGAGVPEPANQFTNPPLDPVLLDNIQYACYTTPTPVQKYSIPIVAAGRDLVACAQTGSRKTGGFLFPILSASFAAGPRAPPTDPNASYGRRRAYPTALILAPTRELVSHIHDEARKFAYRSWILISSSAKSSVLSATPGHLVDLIERGRISLANIQYPVLDEADRMLDMGFEPQIRRIVQGEDMPGVMERQTLMFSATFPRDI
ncbi:DEAD-box ATP-dependent RNA helicase, partial [Ceratobasidium sp. 414]